MCGVRWRTLFPTPMRILLFLLVIAGFVFLLLATQPDNYGRDVQLLLPFVNMTVTGPLLAWIAGSLGAGFLLGYLAGLPGRFGAASRARRAEKQLASVESTTARTVSDVRADAAAARANAAAANQDASETQRLADEVARGVASRDVPPRSTL